MLTKCFFQNSTKDRMTHLNISVAVKHPRDNNRHRKWTFGRKISTS